MCVCVCVVISNQIKKYSLSMFGASLSLLIIARILIKYFMCMSIAEKMYL